jgi:hypothetical protein
MVVAFTHGKRVSGRSDKAMDYVGECVNLPETHGVTFVLDLPAVVQEFLPTRADDALG